MRYAVGFLDFFENDLKVKIVEARSWQEALDKAFGDRSSGFTSDDMEKCKNDAVDQEWCFDVKEIL